MKTPTNNSNDCLNECKEQIRKCISSSSLKINYEDITSVIVKPINVNSFQEWLDRNINTFNSKTNIQTYFKKAFINEMSKGTFDYKEPAINPTTLIEALRNKGVVITPNDTLYIDIMWRYYLKRGMKIEEVQKLNSQIVAYMKEGQTFNDYISLVKRSKPTQAYKINWIAIDVEYDHNKKMWEDIITLTPNEEDLEVDPSDWEKNLEETIRIAKTNIWEDKEDDND